MSAMSPLKASLLVALSTTLWSPIALLAKNPSKFSTADELEIRQTVRAVQQAILEEDVKALVHHVSDEGLICTDTVYAVKKVRGFLENKNSYLYMSLFDSSRFAAECGGQYPSRYPAISEKEFLQTANHSMTILRLDLSWAQVTLTSPNSHHYPREWFLHRENGRWKLAGQSWIIGNCTCG